MSEGKALRDGLVSRIAKMGAHRQGVQGARDQLIARAKEQLDTMGPAIAAIEHAVDAGQGGILAQRRLRTLIKERDRLQQVIATDQERRDRKREDS